MAIRQTRRKDVYERIEDIKQDIKSTEEKLSKLNSHLNELYKERDELEMKKLFHRMREQNIDIAEALKMLHK